MIVAPEQDHVAVAIQPIDAGTVLLREGHDPITLRTAIPAGHRFAIRAVPAGIWVRQYGQPFALSRGLAPGDPVNDATVDSVVPEVSPDELILQMPVLRAWEGPLPTFDGFHRAGDQVGTRNWVLIVPTSMCAAHEATQIASRAELQGPYTRAAYPNVDGVTAIAHNGGCACPDPTVKTAGPGAYESTLRMLGQHIRHPNVGAALVIELGCEKTNHTAFDEYFGTDDLGTLYGKPVLRLSVQGSGGTKATIEKGLVLLPWPVRPRQTAPHARRPR